MSMTTRKSGHDDLNYVARPARAEPPGERPRIARTWLDCLAVMFVGGGILVLLSSRTPQDGTTENPNRVQPPIPGGDTAPALGQVKAKPEKTALDTGTNRVYRFRSRHPWIYGMGAFIIGGALATLFVAIPYFRTTYAPT